jgi:hypothetical protein
MNKDIFILIWRLDEAFQPREACANRSDLYRMRSNSDVVQRKEDRK